jgi:hypothetical protein
MPGQVEDVRRLLDNLASGRGLPQPPRPRRGGVPPIPDREVRRIVGEHFRGALHGVEVAPVIAHRGDEAAGRHGLGDPLGGRQICGDRLFNEEGQAAFHGGELRFTVRKGRHADQQGLGRDDVEHPTPIRKHSGPRHSPRLRLGRLDDGVGHANQPDAWEPCKVCDVSSRDAAGADHRDANGRHPASARTGATDPSDAS